MNGKHTPFTVTLVIIHHVACDAFDFKITASDISRLLLYNTFTNYSINSIIFAETVTVFALTIQKKLLLFTSTTSFIKAHDVDFMSA